MGFDIEALRAVVNRHGQVVRVVIAAVRGSSPREVGAAMLVWPMKDGVGQAGTIGGGALEFQAADAARRMSAPVALKVHALGPDLGQCCGGAVTLLSEVYDAKVIAGLEGDVVARPVERGAALTLGVRRLLAQARQGEAPEVQLLDGWMIEPVHKPGRDIWIWGAGHVGRALVQVLAPLPDVAITWVDTAPERFPENVSGARVVPVARPAELARHAPEGAEHLVVTYSHALDLELCDQLLRRGFGSAGLIGSATKWARFRSRLAALGHGDDQIGRITCPIGDPGLGKHPQMIAVGVAAEMLRPVGAEFIRKERHA
ncbi:MAG: xanthine dehydrogenase accessory protein XdhC [Rhodobacteraceae bacterium]|nr:xanthine dehydrogenase accessory protein XdhC [Paracoccaceae bacterium]